MIPGAFYIGSCRYQPYFQNYFPPRLHTTKEILQFLSNYNTIDLDQKHINIIFGDSIHGEVINKTKAFISDPSITGCDTLCLEICSRKVGRLDGWYVNKFYSDRDKISGVETQVLDDSKLMEDLRQIKEIAFSRFGIKRIILIPHINLKLRSGERIKDRDSLYNFLKTQSEFEVIDITAFIEETHPELALEDIMPDSLHLIRVGIR